MLDLVVKAIYWRIHYAFALDQEIVMSNMEYCVKQDQFLLISRVLTFAAFSVMNINRITTCTKYFRDLGHSSNEKVVKFNLEQIRKICHRQNLQLYSITVTSSPLFWMFVRMFVLVHFSQKCLYPFMRFT